MSLEYIFFPTASVRECECMVFITHVEFRCEHDKLLAPARLPVARLPPHTRVAACLTRISNVPVREETLPGVVHSSTLSQLITQAHIRANSCASMHDFLSPCFVFARVGEAAPVGGQAAGLEFENQLPCAIAQRSMRDQYWTLSLDSSSSSSLPSLSL